MLTTLTVQERIIKATEFGKVKSPSTARPGLTSVDGAALDMDPAHHLRRIPGVEP